MPLLRPDLMNNIIVVSLVDPRVREQSGRLFGGGDPRRIITPAAEHVRDPLHDAPLGRVMLPGAEPQPVDPLRELRRSAFDHPLGRH